MNDEISFGHWIRRRRKSLDLTQKQLAERVGCATATIVKIEADERRPSREIAQLLAERLEIPLEERAEFLRVARRERRVAALASPDNRRDDHTATCLGLFHFAFARSSYSADWPRA